jgi:hypothetical protein
MPDCPELTFEGPTDPAGQLTEEEGELRHSRVLAAFDQLSRGGSIWSA